MKKLLIISNLLFLLIIVYQGCKPGGTTDLSKIKVCPACKDYTNHQPAGRINWQFAQTIADNYKRDKSKGKIWTNQKQTDSTDARSVRFSLETLKSYIWNIEKASCANGCKDSLGIRIYYARYPVASDPIWSTIPGLRPVERYANLHTVFIVPTYWDKQWNIHFDFEPGGDECHKAFDTISRKPTFILFGTAGSGEAQNHGGPIPPDEDRGLAF